MKLNGCLPSMVGSRLLDSWKKMRNKSGLRNIYILFIACIMLLSSCGKTTKTGAIEDQQRTVMSELHDSLQLVVDRYPGEIGVAVITDRGDTLTINNEAKYPLMSVFKLHQAIALCSLFERTGQSLDSVVRIPRRDLNPDTWSPMLKDYSNDVIEIPIRKLLTYTLTLSDNNASNWMFEHLQSASDADGFIASVIPRESFNIKHTEAEMGLDHSLAYENNTSPLGAAILINRFYTDSILGTEDENFIRNTLDGCMTGQDRIVAPLKDLDGIIVGHKTGSGYRNSDGVLAAHNDVGFVRLPDGHHYSISVFVKDFDGSEKEASEAIAKISEIIYSYTQK